ncbi:uncharacterized protein PAC_13951 [Phialocephala subalpina]|uniref:Uncharacterized protein n=1 Tax=Phialocephala subalpina TaxID=576137 RepID=A0A1L7XGA6_9HELO|nr:uncharacterized protein PAC_13951 [Phialocephala subalpina]
MRQRRMQSVFDREPTILHTSHPQVLHQIGELKIVAWRHYGDTFTNAPNALPSPNEWTRLYEDVMNRLLNKHIRDIASLKELVVLDSENTEDSIELAKEAIEFIEKHTDDRSRAEWVAKKKRKEDERGPS